MSFASQSARHAPQVHDLSLRDACAGIPSSQHRSQQHTFCWPSGESRWTSSPSVCNNNDEAAPPASEYARSKVKLTYHQHTTRASIPRTKLPFLCGKNAHVHKYQSAHVAHNACWDGLMCVYIICWLYSTPLVRQRARVQTDVRALNGDNGSDGSDENQYK